MWRNKAVTSLGFCLGVVLIGCLLQLTAAMKGNTVVFPGVADIVKAFVRLVQQKQTWQLVGTTLKHVAVAMAISTFLGVTLGVGMGQSRFVRALLTPMMNLLRSLPMIVLVVIVMVLDSADKYARVPVIASTLVLTPMIAQAACEGCLRIERELIDVYRLNSRLNLKVLRHVHLPLMGGYLAQGWINAAGMGVKLAVSCEYLVQIKNSLGKAVYQSFSNVMYEETYAYALLMILLVVVLGELPLAIGRWVTRLREAKQ